MINRVRSKLGRVWQWSIATVAQVKSDTVGPRASVQPFAGWLLAGLFFFVVYLTVVYAPGAFQRSRQGEGVDRTGIISLAMGYWTIGIVGVVTLLAAWEPHIARWANGRFVQLRGWLLRQRGTVRLLIFLVGGCLLLLWRMPSFLLSAIDMVLARPVAMLVGVTQASAARRYLWGGSAILGALAAGLLAPSPFGLFAAMFGIVAIVAILRRWIWFESDRDAFLVERSAREEEQRVGFAQDLRDEALTAMVFLFVLIPLLLRQFQLWTCPTGTGPDCAFVLEGDGLPVDQLGQFLAWLGYFGAELAKAVPFVDWSEVFKVANDSPIKPQTTFGAQVVFVMRAALDLMLLAAVVQAVGIAGRLREQNTAFRSNHLPILEPFDEARELLSRHFEPAVEMRPVDQPTVKGFPDYDGRRLRQLIMTRDGSIPLPVRKAAVALLARAPGTAGQDLQAEGGLLAQEWRRFLVWLREFAPLLGRRPVEDVGPSSTAGSESDEVERKVTERLQRATMEVTEWFLSEWASKESDAELRDWTLQIASGVSPERGPQTRGADIQRLRGLLKDPLAGPAVRGAAARRLGRLGNDAASVQLLLEMLADTREPLGVRADAAVALTKLAPADSNVQTHIEQLVEQAPPLLEELRRGEDLLFGERLLPTMATAYALARLHRGASVDDIANRFDASLRDHARRAALIQIEPMDTPAGSNKEIGSLMEQMVQITPGHGQFPRTFTMGADENDAVPGARVDQRPKVEITMGSPFAFGRFPVTVREYRGFAKATGRNAPANADHPDRANTPVVEVSWHDANAYAAWLERITGERYRLPSEAEWEYACRAGTPTLFWWGPDWDSARAVEQYTAVNHQGPNPWGIWDVYGHVYEWCSDLWHDSHANRPQSALPWIADTNLVPRSGDLVHRVVRSGSWSHPVGPVRLRDLRSSYRNEQKPTHIQTNYGFRLARSLNA